MKFLSLVGLTLLLATKSSGQPSNESLFNQGSLKLISSQFKFTEGPSVNAQGEIFFTDQPNNTIWKYGTDGRLSLFTKNSSRANGTYVDKSGNLIVCADEANELLTFTSDGVAKLLYKNPTDSALNGPNDLWIDRKGGIYFTDPYYQREYWSRKSPSITKERVYYLPKGARELLIVEEGLIRPNGIVGTPDGKYLYVADAKGGRTYKYEIGNGGILKNRQLFVNRGSDGITLDHKGNVYLTGRGVDIFNPKGEKIGHIDIPENHTANLCFGGKKRNMLFITASKSIYILPMLVHGVE